MMFASSTYFGSGFWLEDDSTYDRTRNSKVVRKTLAIVVRFEKFVIKIAVR